MGTEGELLVVCSYFVQPFDRFTPSSHPPQTLPVTLPHTHTHTQPHSYAHTHTHTHTRTHTHTHTGHSRPWGHSCTTGTVCSAGATSGPCGWTAVQILHGCQGKVGRCCLSAGYLVLLDKVRMGWFILGAVPSPHTLLPVLAARPSCSQHLGLQL